ncbi:MAG TPA: hypothetical protein VMM37_09745 [Bacteroidota bacterium]|nr:hypothetical protein [Bacteroidota bacterium]
MRKNANTAANSLLNPSFPGRRRLAVLSLLNLILIILVNLLVLGLIILA